MWFILNDLVKKRYSILYLILAVDENFVQFKMQLEIPQISLGVVLTTSHLTDL